MTKEALRRNLHYLYSDNSKHAVYQNIPMFVREELDYHESINEEWRGDTARYKLLKETINFRKKVVGDFGANTGFFSLSLAFENPDSTFIAYEMNVNHVKFMTSIKSYFGLKNLFIESVNLNMSGIDKLPKHDLVLNFNVLHHGGVDFDSDIINDATKFHDYASEYLKKLHSKTDQMVFQMGYNWGGNKQKPIVSPEKPVEFILYLKKLFLASDWLVNGIFLHDNNERKYSGINLIDNLDPEKLKTLTNELDRMDFFRNSEFYKRPIVMSSRKDNL